MTTIEKKLVKLKQKETFLLQKYEELVGNGDENGEDQ